MTNGTFKTMKVATLRFCFLNSQSKSVYIKADIVTLSAQLGLPMYDLVIGVKAMSKMGIKLDFTDNCITLEHVKLPMHNHFTMG